MSLFQLFAPCLQLPPKGRWEPQEVLPGAPWCTKHLICCAHRCGSGPWGHPALPRVLPGDKAARRRRQGRENRREIKAPHSNNETALSRSFSTQDSPSASAAGAETPMSRSQPSCQGNKPYLFPLPGTSGADSTDKKRVQNTQSLLKYAF